MPDSHLTLTGEWVTCENAAACKSLYRMPGMTPEEVKALPPRMLGMLLDAVDPGSTTPFGETEWRDAEGQLHRDYDLPAVVHVNGDRAWYQHGKRHRYNGRAALITHEGMHAWYRHGEYLRGYTRFSELLALLAEAQRKEQARGYHPMHLPPSALWHKPLVAVKPPKEIWLWGSSVGVVRVVDL